MTTDQIRGIREGDVFGVTFEYGGEEMQHHYLVLREGTRADGAKQFHTVSLVPHQAINGIHVWSEPQLLSEKWNILIKAGSEEGPDGV